MFILLNGEKRIIQKFMKYKRLAFHYIITEQIVLYHGTTLQFTTYVSDSHCVENL